MRTKQLRYFIRLAALFAALLFLLSPEVSAENAPHKTKQPFGVDFYQATPGELFYVIPAHIGGTIFTPVGAIVYWPFTAGSSMLAKDYRGRSLLPPVQLASDTFGMFGAYLLGGPFWCLKKAFWDFPVWIFSGGEDDSPAAKEQPHSSD